MASDSPVSTIYDDANRSHSKHSVFRSLLPSKAHRRHQSTNDVPTLESLKRNQVTSLPPAVPVKDPTHKPEQLPLGERAPNRASAESPSATQQAPFRPKGALHKKTKSAVSLKSLRNYMDRKDSNPSEDTEETAGTWNPKKVKSSNSLSAFLKLSQRNRKGDASKEVRDKENRSPTETYDNMPSPAWSHYEADNYVEQPRRAPAMESRRTLEDEMSLYTPKQYGPAQQRNFYDYQQPSLTKRLGTKPRPKSDCLPENRKLQDMANQPQRTVSDSQPAAQPQITKRVDTRQSGISKAVGMETKGDSNQRNQSRIQAVISAFNSKDSKAGESDKVAIQAKNVDSEFEKLLDARNIPQNMRDKMRSLDTHIKMDFIQKHQTERETPVSPNSGYSDNSGPRGRQQDQKDEQHSHDGKGSRSRSRSRGFTFSKASLSPSKKQRAEGTSSVKRPKSIDLSQSASSFKLATPSASVTSLSMTACHDTAADPSDFVHYMREIQKPEMVEVGKMHKLRLLLRNETVGWVNMFIADGGMDEIVQLLYRIMKVEWREEHEDNLLHETLLCLKALCTTTAALDRLTAMESELFPALLRMLFDEEKKGPSEFTTRGIVTHLLFTQLLSASTSSVAAERALRILSYLRDPPPPEDNQPLAFIANIYQSRPYRVWCKEVTNVTKEVFWIFLHHLNVIPIKRTVDSVGDNNNTNHTFLQRHFPPPRPPVPAAPYVGGVEWDATNYLASHLDLMNGLIASLPTADERNQLRTELRASGFEKVMGGSLRTCKEKFYSAVHDCLRTWVAAAVEDGWPYTMVREGPPRMEASSPPKSPSKMAPAASPKKKGLVGEKPPKLELALALDGAVGQSSHQVDVLDNWL